MKFVLFIALVVITPLASASRDCREMSRDFYTKKVPDIKKFFIESKRFSIDRVDVSAGLDCGDRVYFEFEAKPEFNNFGYHWEVMLEKSTGKMTMIDGI
jgi:hypothetical protein